RHHPAAQGPLWLPGVVPLPRRPGRRRLAALEPPRQPARPGDPDVRDVARPGGIRPRREVSRPRLHAARRPARPPVQLGPSQGGKPVLFVWGFFSDRFGPALAHRIIDFFKTDPRYGVTLVGGCPWAWRAEKDAEWARAQRRFDVISPWNVGNVMTAGGQKHAA